MADQGLGQFLQDITTYLILLIIIATSGSLQFGYHLVCPLPEASRIHSAAISTLPGQEVASET